MSTLDCDGLSVTYTSDRTGCPDLRLIHYNDVYHVEYAMRFLDLRGVPMLTDSQDPALPNPLAESRASNPSWTTTAPIHGLPTNPTS